MSTLPALLPSLMRDWIIADLLADEEEGELVPGSERLATLPPRRRRNTAHAYPAHPRA